MIAILNARGIYMKRPNKKIEIINAVTKLFSQKGYMISMSEIAKEVGIRVASIYTHFEGKDEIIYLSIEEEVNKYYDYLDEVFLSLENKNCKEALEGLLEAILLIYKSSDKIRYWHNIYLINGQDVSKKCLDLIDIRTTDYIKKLRIIFENGVNNNQILVSNTNGALYLYMSMIEGILKGILLRNEVSRDYVPYIWEAYWNGIKKR